MSLNFDATISFDDTQIQEFLYDGNRSRYKLPPAEWVRGNAWQIGMKKLVLLLFILLSTNAESQVYPPPVNLPIPNILQETPLWCWVAVAQQIIYATVGDEQTPPQCFLVATANGFHPDYCCAGMGNPDCVRTGSIQQIQHLIGRFGGKTSNLAPPTDPMTLYHTLSSGKAIILHIRSGYASTHVVVLTGMSFIPNHWGGIEPVLHINDPVSYFTTPVPYQSLIPLWIEAIVVN